MAVEIATDIMVAAATSIADCSHIVRRQFSNCGGRKTTLNFRVMLWVVQQDNLAGFVKVR
jgi:hypothetical protein